MMVASRNRLLSIALNSIAAYSISMAHVVSTVANPYLEDPVRALERLPKVAREIRFKRGQTVFPNGGHFQGIQSYYDKSLNEQICFVSSDSHTIGYFIAVAFDRGAHKLGTVRHFQYLPSDGKQPPLRHAGGIQLIGDVVVVGLEDNQEKCRSHVQFWDVSDPFSPKLRAPLTIVRESDIANDKTSGAVGIVRRAHDHLLAVANWDAEALDFYTSNSLPLSDDDCKFMLVTRWSKARADKAAWKPNEHWGTYQCINLVSDREGNVFLFGLETTAAGQDFIDLYSVNLTEDAPNMICKLSNKQMIFKGNAHFRNAGGLSIKSATELSCYATERNAHDETTICVSP